MPNGEDQIVRLRRDLDIEDPFKRWVQKSQQEIREKRGS